MGRETAAAAYGFLSISGTLEQGLLGGLLVLNELGRPLEFHCTAPVKANRAQQILYGPTLAPFLYGEQIGTTLAARTKRPMRMYFVSQPETLAMRPTIDVPVALVLPRDAAQRAELSQHRFETVSLAGYTLGTHFADPDDPRRIAEACEALLDFDLLEPFERIEEAVAEAQKTAA